MVRMSREMERAERARIREAERQHRAMERETRVRDKFERNSYVASREADTNVENGRIIRQIEELKHVLSSRLGQDPAIDFKTLFKAADERVLNTVAGLTLPDRPIRASFYPKPPSVLIRWLPIAKRKFIRKCDEANHAFNVAQDAYNEVATKRSECFRLMKEQVNKQNNAVIDFAKNYTPAESNAVNTYFELVLGRSKYPESFPSERKTAYGHESKQLVVEFVFPAFADAVPNIEKYRYIRKTDEIIEVKRSEKLRHAIYSDVIAQAVIRCLYDIFHADRQEVVETVVLNAHVSTADPATGHKIHPCLVSVRTSRDRSDLELTQVDPVSCLKELRAAVSNQPGELIAVRPILEFNMIDPRFVQEGDVLSTLVYRPNLMELSPSEFESLITNLFSQMGLDTKLTQPSRDGGVLTVSLSDSAGLS